MLVNIAEVNKNTHSNTDAPSGRHVGFVGMPTSPQFTPGESSDKKANNDSSHNTNSGITESRPITENTGPNTNAQTANQFQNQIGVEAGGINPSTHDAEKYVNTTEKKMISVEDTYTDKIRLPQSSIVDIGTATIVRSKYLVPKKSGTEQGLQLVENLFNVTKDINEFINTKPPNHMVLRSIDT
jgi:hypothetical protein